ncbi:hypothetical protein ACFQZ4_26040 [Catellatospora coxensis]
MVEAPAGEHQHGGVEHLLLTLRARHPAAGRVRGTGRGRRVVT